MSAAREFTAGARCQHRVERARQRCPLCEAWEAMILTVKVGDRVRLDDGFQVRNVVGTIGAIDANREDFGPEYGPRSDYDVIILAEDGDSAYYRSQVAEVLA